MEEIITQEYYEYCEGFISGMNETKSAFYNRKAIPVYEIKDGINGPDYWYLIGRENAVYYFFNLLKEDPTNIEAINKLDVPELIMNFFVESVKTTNEEYESRIPISKFVFKKSNL